MNKLMQIKFKLVIWGLFLFLGSTVSFAQQETPWGEDQKVGGSVLRFKVLGELDGAYYASGYVKKIGGKNNFLYKINQNHEIIESTLLEFPESKKSEVWCKFVELNGITYNLYSVCDLKTNKLTLYKSKYTEGSFEAPVQLSTYDLPNKKSDLLEKGYIDLAQPNTNTDISKNYNQNKVITNHEKNKVLFFSPIQSDIGKEGVVFTVFGKEMQLLWQKSINSEKSGFRVLNAVLSNDGVVYVVGAIFDDQKEAIGQNFKVYRITEHDVSVSEIELENAKQVQSAGGYLNDLDSLMVCGFYYSGGNQKTSKIEGFFNGSPLIGNSLKMTPIMESWVNMFPKPKDQILAKHIHISNIVRLADGTTAVVAEYKTEDKTYINLLTERSSVSYFSGPLLLYFIDAKGNLRGMNCLKKEKDEKPGLVTYHLVSDKEKLQVIHTQDVPNTYRYASYLVTFDSAGNMTNKRALVTKQDENYFFMPDYQFSGDGKCVLVNLNSFGSAFSLKTMRF